MNVPLNIDWQQILLHLMNFAILAGGLYLLLYKPVKAFIAKREEYYRAMAEKAAQTMKEAQDLKASYEAQLQGAQEELEGERAKAQKLADEAAQQQLADAQTRAAQVLKNAQAAAEREHAKMLEKSREEIEELAMAATKKLLLQSENGPLDQFLNSVEGSGDHDGQS